MIYRRPGSITESFISQLQETIQSIDLGQYKEVIVTGDFNFDALKLEQDNEVQLFFNTSYVHIFFSAIDFQTDENS